MSPPLPPVKREIFLPPLLVGNQQVSVKCLRDNCASKRHYINKDRFDLAPSSPSKQAQPSGVMCRSDGKLATSSKLQALLQ